MAYIQSIEASVIDPALDEFNRAILAAIKASIPAGYIHDYSSALTNRIKSFSLRRRILYISCSSKMSHLASLPNSGNKQNPCGRRNWNRSVFVLLPGNYGNRYALNTRGGKTPLTSMRKFCSQILLPNLAKLSLSLQPISFFPYFAPSPTTTYS